MVNERFGLGFSTMVSMPFADCVDGYFDLTNIYIRHAGTIYPIDDVKDDNKGNTWVWFGDDMSKIIDENEDIFIFE